MSAPQHARRNAPSGTARRPINAAEAAKRAARAPRGEGGALRQAAAGTNRERSEQLGRRREDSSHRGAIVGAFIGIALAIVVLVVAGRAVLGVLLYDDRAAGASMAADADASAATEPTAVAVDADGSITFLGSTYSIATADDGTYLMTYQTSASANAVTAFTITGEPVGFALYEGTFYVVSNTEGSYHIQTFVPGDGSLAVDFRDGSGTITSIALDGSELQLTDDTDKVYTLELAHE